MGRGVSVTLPLATTALGNRGFPHGTDFPR